MNVEFREAVYSDVTDIIKLCNECFKENTDLKYAEKSFNETKNDKNQIYVVGVLAGEIVAHAKITVIPTMYEPMSTYAILNHVCVKEDLRRHNIATKMLMYIEEICKRKGCCKMELWSMNFRIAAHECYKNYGFNIDDAKFFSKVI